MFVFLTFVTLSQVSMKELGAGLAVAVLLDATLVRGVLLPAAMAALDDAGLVTGLYQGALDRAPEAAELALQLGRLASGEDRAQIVADYEAELLNPYQAADLGYVDAVVPPRETRAQLVRALRATHHKREARPAKKHGNMPL